MTMQQEGEDQKKGRGGQKRAQREFLRTFFEPPSEPIPERGGHPWPFALGLLISVTVPLN